MLLYNNACVIDQVMCLEERFVNDFIHVSHQINGYDSPRLTLEVQPLSHLEVEMIMISPTYIFSTFKAVDHITADGIYPTILFYY